MKPASDRNPLRGPSGLSAALLRIAGYLPYIQSMNQEPAPGIARTHSYLTTLKMRASQLKADVFSTPAMIGLMERTCVDLTEPYLDENEQTVGIHVDVRHLAPTRIGQSVTVTAELREVKNNKLRYAVSATNDQGVKIGEGTHRRAVIDTETFAEAPNSAERGLL
jgi:fluoroacetyl-CoA thioesterase